MGFSLSALDFLDAFLASEKPDKLPFLALRVKSPSCSFAAKFVSSETLQQRWQFANRFDHRVGRSGAEPLRHWRTTEHTNGPHARAMRHFDILGSVPNVHTNLWQGAEFIERHPQRRRMRFPARRVFAANFH